MKKLLSLIALIITSIINAQAPQGFNYQATIRNSAGALIFNQNVNFKFNIMLNSSTSAPVYTETKTVTTDDLGQVSLVVGTGTATTGTFSSINWANGSYYLGIELNTGSGYVAMGITQLLSVPYALYAQSSGNNQSKGKPSIMITGNIDNAQAAAQIAAELGPYTENIYIENTTGLTDVDLSGISSIANLIITNNSNLSTINLSGISTIYNSLIIMKNTSLKTLSFPALKSTSANWDTFEISDNDFLTSISFPVLTTILKNIAIVSNIKLKSVKLPSLIFCGEDIYFRENALPSSEINALLNTIVSLQYLGSSAFIDLRGQTPLAPPTGQGIIDKQTIINKGNTVITD